MQQGSVSRGQHMHGQGQLLWCGHDAPVAAWLSGFAHATTSSLVVMAGWGTLLLCVVAVLQLPLTTSAYSTNP